MGRTARRNAKLPFRHRASRRWRAWFGGGAPSDVASLWNGFAGRIEIFASFPSSSFPSSSLGTHRTRSSASTRVAIERARGTWLPCRYELSTSRPFECSVRGLITRCQAELGGECVPKPEFGNEEATRRPASPARTLGFAGHHGSRSRSRHLETRDEPHVPAQFRYPFAGRRVWYQDCSRTARSQERRSDDDRHARPEQGRTRRDQPAGFPPV